uniref:NADP-dependent oxidoreductase domain-containing protein n=1 Tax=Monopterus albus TaxID=43700 RepID=A0A3Q3K109_MONAL
MSVAQGMRCATVRLSNGLSIPILGLGTSSYGGYSHDAIVYALTECGVRHIDTAQQYDCEEKLNKSIRESGLPRSDLWLTNKLWPMDYGYQAAKKACLHSCALMGVEYFGVCRAIGVSNFKIHHLEQLEEDCNMVPHVNQVEYHPFQQPTHMIEYCHEKGIVFEGYCPLARGQVLSNPTVHQIAEKYGRTPAQICIRWSIQNGVVTIPKSVKKNRIKENCQVFGFQLEEADMAALGRLHDGRHVGWDPRDVE